MLGFLFSRVMLGFWICILVWVALWLSDCALSVGITLVACIVPCMPIYRSGFEDGMMLGFDDDVPCH